MAAVDVLQGVPVCLTSEVDALAHRILEEARKKQAEHGDGPEGRYCIGLAGIPGSGKSTIAALLVAKLNIEDPTLPPALLVPQDGFHRTQAELDVDPDPAYSYKRRGSPFTFDPVGLIELIKRIKTTAVCSAPAFSHEAKDPVAGAISIDPHHRVIVFEGSFLLLDEEPWRDISKEMDESWLYDIDADVAFERVVKRHIAAGLADSEETARAKAAGNDILNGQLILEKLVKPNLRIREG